jgi:hypothetical protein
MTGMFGHAAREYLGSKSIAPDSNKLVKEQVVHDIVYIRYIIDKVFAIFFRTVETLNLAQWICLKIG